MNFHSSDYYTENNYTSRNADKRQSVESGREGRVF